MASSSSSSSFLVYILIWIVSFPPQAKFISLALAIPKSSEQLINFLSDISIGCLKGQSHKKLIYNSSYLSQTLPTSSPLSQWNVPSSMQQYKQNTGSHQGCLFHSHTVYNTLFILKYCTYYFNLCAFLCLSISINILGQVIIISSPDTSLST